MVKDGYSLAVKSNKRKKGKQLKNLAFQGPTQRRLEKDNFLDWNVELKHPGITKESYKARI